MNRSGETTTLPERLDIAERALLGQTDTAIAAALGCSPETVCKWRRRYQRRGRDGLASRMGRPRTGALGAYPEALRGELKALRIAHPGWGPKTLLPELLRTGIWTREQMPSPARCAVFIKQEGLARAYEPQTHLPQPQRVRPQKPHDEWQMDAQGPRLVDGMGKVSVINVADVFSHVKTESYPHLWGTAPATYDYYIVLRRAFLTYGLPQRITLDHDSVFYDNTTQSPFPTRLHLWLRALDVDVIFTRKRRPTDHALIERGHQTITAQTLTGQTWTDQRELWAGLDERRDALNGYLPSQPLGGHPPLLVYPEAGHSGRPYQPAWERDMLDLERVYPYLAQSRWFRTTNCYGEFFVGAQRYSFGCRCNNRLLEITFDARTQEFVVQPEGEKAVSRFLVKGLSKEDLMGDLASLLALPAYQLFLPLSRETVQKLELCRLLTGTTL